MRWLLSLVLALAALLPALAHAEDLAAVKARGTLIWGGDQEGGGPYVYPREDDASKVTGFEVDLADRIGKSLGVKAVFQQGNWDKLPDLVKAGKIDLVLNGYEWSPERADALEPTLPYYVYRLVLLARKADGSIATWEDVKKPGASGKRKVGVLTGSAAEALAKKTFGADVELVSYDGSTDAMREVETGKLDATVQDTPIASFYASRFPGLHPIGEPRGKGYYIAFAKKGDKELADAVSRAIAGMVTSGELERLYGHWRLWNADQAELALIVQAGRFYGKTYEPLAPSATADATDPGVSLGVRKRGWEVVRAYGGILLQSAGMTVFLSFASFPFAVLLGLGIALGRRSGPAWVRAPLAGLVEALRGTPLMLQLYLIFFLLPELGVRLPALATSLIGLAINYAAYESEIYRSALGAVPPGQAEAARALGMSRSQAFRHVILPQAARIALPPTVNDFIALFKDTSVCSVVTVVELTKRTSVLSQSTQATVELMLMSGALYLLMSYPLSRVARVLERRLAPDEAEARA